MSIPKKLKLALHRETLRSLAEDQLQVVHGGAPNTTGKKSCVGDCFDTRVPCPWTAKTMCGE
jgi:hypothetical protein